jgi:hypothetical protein
MRYSKCFFEKASICWALGLMPVILATQEAEIRRIVVRSQPWQTARETLSQKHPLQKKELAEWLKVKALSSSAVPQNKGFHDQVPKGNLLV